MKNLVHHITLFLVFFVALSCTRENFLDIEPRGTVVPSTIEDFRLLLDNVTPDETQGFTTFTSGFDEKHALTSLVDDDHTTFDELSNLSNAQRNAYLFNTNFYTPVEQDPDWDFYYGQIFLANIILDGLTRVEDGTPEQIEVLVAEAKLQRAYAYFNLVNIYATHYNPTTADTDLGVPIRQGIELEGVDLTRATVMEVYDLILNDIDSSINELPDTQPLNTTFRPSKAAALGLLAKIYLYRAEYQMALNTVNEAINIYGALRNIADDPVNTSNGTRFLPRVVQDPEVVWFKQSFRDNNILFPSDGLLALYEEGDLRLEWSTLTFVSSATGMRQSYTAGNLNDNFSVGINTPELYLIRAECNARLSNITEANNDLNLLRQNRFTAADFMPLNITEQQALLNFVKQERRRESIGNYDRLFDIKRYNLFDNDAISVTHTLGETTVTLPPNDPRFVFPIGETYIQQNPEIIQNNRN